MYQTVNEPVEVIGKYAKGHFFPVKFRWGQRVLPVDTITLQSDIKDGGMKQRIYSVTSGGTLYRLLFNRETEDWLLAEMWCE